MVEIIFHGYYTKFGLVIMKKILFSLIIISIALVGITLVNAADADVHASDVPADVDSAKLPDLWASSDLGWTHHERNPRGFDSADLDSLGWNHDDRHQRG